MVGERVFARLDEASARPADRRGRRHEDLRPRRRRRLAVGADEVAASWPGCSAARHDANRAQRLARHVRAGAAARGRDAGGPDRLCPAVAPDDVPAVLDAVSTARIIRAASAWSTSCPSSSARPASPSPAAASPIRSRSTIIALMAASRGWSAPSRIGPAGDGRGGVRLRPARPRRRRLPGRDQVADRRRGARPRRNISSATPTRATAAPSPTGW